MVASQIKRGRGRRPVKVLGKPFLETLFKIGVLKIWFLI